MENHTALYFEYVTTDGRLRTLRVDPSAVQIDDCIRVSKWIAHVLCGLNGDDLPHPSTQMDEDTAGESEYVHLDGFTFYVAPYSERAYSSVADRRRANRLEHSTRNR